MTTMLLDAEKTLGKYRVISSIATGGMGEVLYAKADGVEGFSRLVAIKKLLPHLCGDRSFVDMMVTEAKLTVLLDHPNIVRVFDLAKENDIYFIVMEFVPGVTVGQFLEYAISKNLELPVKLCVFVVLEMLRGLAYAHLLETPKGEPNGVLHRDISPQNVLITGRGDVKLADFGIARAKHQIKQTERGAVTGKVGYLAPEQVAGGEGDERADLYAVGIVLWEMLARRRLFKGLDDADSYRLMSEAYVPDVRQLRQDIPEGLFYCLLRCLHREPSERYESARAFIDGLQEATDAYDTDDLKQVAVDFLAAQPELFAQVHAQVEAAEGAALAAPSVFPPVPPAAEKLENLPRARLTFLRMRRVAGLLAAALLGTVGLGLLSHYLGRRHDGEASKSPEALVLRPLDLASGPAVKLSGSAENAALPSAGIMAAAGRARLSIQEVQEVALQKRAALFGCFSRPEKGGLPPQVVASLQVAADGHVVRSETRPSVSADADACLARVFCDFVFREREGEDVTVEIPLSLRRL